MHNPSKGRAPLIALSLSLSSALPVYAQVADTSIRAAVAPEPLGRLVDIGGRRLHLYCTGKGAPTTILLSGASAFSLDWYPVQRELSKASRVCSYDRAGLAWSDPGPRPHTEAQALLDLHTLLSKAKEGGPFLLVGHSLGGHLARLYAARYPREVAGILILDSGVETTLQNVNGRFVRGTDAALPRAIPSPRLTLADSERDLTPAEQQGVAQFRKFVGPPTIDDTYAKLPPEIQRLRLWAMSQPSSVVADFNAYGAEEAVLSLADRIHNPEQLGALPLIVIGHTPVTLPANTNPASGDARRVLERPEELRAMGRLSSNSVVLVADHSGHEIQLDQPELVLAAVEQLRLAIATHAKVRAPTVGAPVLPASPGR